jgi:hypothetical protein
MKRVFSVMVATGGALVLWGCPIYSNDHRVCTTDGSCYSCANDYYSSDCTSWTCYTNADCPANEACYSDGVCRATGGTTGGGGTNGSNTCRGPADCPAGETCGADDNCHSQDCSTVGCPSAYVCKLAGGTPQCVAVGTSSDGGGGGGTGPKTQCSADSDCSATTAGAKCLDGTCVAPADQCTDGTQCTNGGQCVQGACTPKCDANTPCPTGFGCDLSKGVCTQNPTPCSTSNNCAQAQACVEQHCVDPCGAGNTCSAGLICVGGGCIPDQKPQFVCNVEGTQDMCSAGSICLRHNCYIACDQDGGADACKTADQFNVCKQVTDNGNTFSVCGSSSNLGSDCDVSAGKNCASPLICIDGYCR